MKNWKQQKTTHLSWDCRNTTKKWCFQTSHAGDTRGWLEPQQGLPVGAGFTKGKLFGKPIALKTQPLPETVL